MTQLPVYEVQDMKALDSLCRSSLAGALTGLALVVVATTGSGCSRGIDYNSLHYEEMEASETEPSKIVFLRRVDGDGYSEIYLKDADGSGVKRLTGGGSPCWSPDGKKIIFEKRVGAKAIGDNIVDYGHFVAYIMDADGGNVRKLIDYPGPLTPTYKLRPFTGNAKDRAQAQACFSQVKELGMAVRMYASDHGDRLPNAESWENDINKYLPVNGSGVLLEGILTCPITDKHYVFNSKLSGVDWRDIRKPAQTPLLWEAEAPDTTKRTQAPHPDGICIAYVDGHVTSVEKVCFCPRRCTHRE